MSEKPVTTWKPVLHRYPKGLTKFQVTGSSGCCAVDASLVLKKVRKNYTVLDM
jgi:hypothetical protein